MSKLTRKRKKKNRSCHSRRNVRFESLETRTLLAADLVAGDPLLLEEVDVSDPPVGVVVAEGTENADFINAFVDADNILHVVINGVEETYDSSQIEGIYVLAKGGNDVVWMDQSVLQWTKIRGGEGADILLGGGGTDYISGGGGADFIFGGYSNDLLIGGADADIIYGGWGHDAMLGGRATSGRCSR